MKKTVLTIALLVLLCTSAQATHIQYYDYADVTEASFSDEYSSWSWTFKLTEDDMELWNLETDTALGDGSYDPSYALHYVTLVIDPNNYTRDPTSDSPNPTSKYLKLLVNGIQIDDWENPIRLYDWGVPGDPVSDIYGIADNYEIEIELFGLSTLGFLTDEKLPLLIDNVNLEGCFDTEPVPEPATLLLLGCGLLGLAGWKRWHA